MTRRQQEGDCRAFSKDSSCYSLAREHYEPLLAAWMAGKAFYSGRTVYGAPMTIKLACIEGVMDCTPDSIATADADDREEEQEKMITGEP